MILYVVCISFSKSEAKVNSPLNSWLTSLGKMFSGRSLCARAMFMGDSQRLFCTDICIYCLMTFDDG